MATVVYKAAGNLFGIKNFVDGRKDENELLAKGDWHKMASRGKNSVRNVFVASAVKTTFENYCGCLTPIAGHEDARHAFNEWSNHAGLESGQSLIELAAEIIGTMTWADCLVMLASDPYAPPGSIAARLKVIEPLRVETPPKYKDKGFVGGQRVVLGVALDKNDIEIGYHVRKAGTDGQKDSDFEFLPRYDKNGRFCSMLVRAPGTRFPGQVRSFPLLGSSMDVTTVLDELVDAAAIEAKTKNTMAVLVETSMPLATPSSPAKEFTKEAEEIKAEETKESEARPLLNLKDMKPGDVGFLPVGDKPHVISAAGDLDLVEQIKQQLKLVAGGIGIPYPALMSDFEKLNFSSSKMMMSKLYRLVELWNYGPMMRLFSEIYKWVCMEHYLLQGILPTPDMLACSWLSPSPPDPDPVKSAKADQIRLQTFTATREDVIGGNGDDWRDKMLSLRKEFDLETELFGSPLSRGAKNESSKDDDEEDDE
jgi:capsid protein